MGFYRVLSGCCLFVATLGCINSANAEAIQTSCFSAFGSGFTAISTGNSSAAYQEALIKAVAAARNKALGLSCQSGAALTCPVGTVDLGITAVQDCEYVGYPNLNPTPGFVANSTCDNLPLANGGPNQGTDGLCVKATCRIVKTCVVPGA